MIVIIIIHNIIMTRKRLYRMIGQVAVPQANRPMTVGRISLLQIGICLRWHLITLLIYHHSNQHQSQCYVIPPSPSDQRHPPARHPVINIIAYRSSLKSSSSSSGDRRHPPTRRSERALSNKDQDPSNRHKSTTATDKSVQVQLCESQPEELWPRGRFGSSC